MKKVLLAIGLAIAFVSSAHATTRCPDGTYVSGDECVITPGGKFVGK